MNAFLIPIPQSGLHFALAFRLLAGLEVLQQKRDLLAECVQGFPPMRASVLVPVAGEELVEEFVDVVEHFLVVRGGS